MFSDHLSRFHQGRVSPRINDGRRPAPAGRSPLASSGPRPRPSPTPTARPRAPIAARERPKSAQKLRLRGEATRAAPELGARPAAVAVVPSPASEADPASHRPAQRAASSGKLVRTTSALTFSGDRGIGRDPRKRDELAESLAVLHKAQRSLLSSQEAIKATEARMEAERSAAFAQRERVAQLVHMARDVLDDLVTKEQGGELARLSREDLQDALHDPVAAFFDGEDRLSRFIDDRLAAMEQLVRDMEAGSSGAPLAPAESRVLAMNR